MNKNKYDNYFLAFTFSMLLLSLITSLLMGISRYFTFMGGFFAGLTFILTGYIVICMFLHRELAPIKSNASSKK